MAFDAINQGYQSTFQPQKLTLGLVVPLEQYPHAPVPAMGDHLARIQLAEKLGFTAVWLRDVPFNVPSFGDAGQLFDPFVYLGFLAASTSRIALGVSSIVLPLRHPAHVAKAAASVDVLSGGRLLLGVASGDRPEEYPAMNIAYDTRGQRFRESMAYIEQVWSDQPVTANGFGEVDATITLLPKPVAGRVPLLITGGSQQSPQWLAEHGDGWMLYPRAVELQARIIEQWRAELRHAGRTPKPVMQPLYIDLLPQADAPTTPIHLGFRSGIKALKHYLVALQGAGVNHVALNLRFNQADIGTTLQRLAEGLGDSFLLQGKRDD